ncbi:MAG TPA: GGDEF domain-containing protein [Bacillota bacterium]|jgi:diguanylate cyclase (GGDEF)-like protein|nr:GGDEF domain-containing protein [Peptococcaceae bacterium MAG4]HPZ42366.1 GGDEF domain-containing protein [Bacillota bacterium]HQD75032.1 GGDEF domain-containing protein [Bacillota bacterium]HUM57589.1 GGDEF domain-containing protein [Bacillota bacterium]
MGVVILIALSHLDNLDEVFLYLVFLLSSLILFFSIRKLNYSYDMDNLLIVSLVGMGIIAIGSAINLFSEILPLPVIVLDTFKKGFLAGGILFFSYGVYRIVQQLIDLTNTDPLTNFYNKRYLEKILALEIERSIRSKLPLAVIFIDLDNFKSINDNMGHATGDSVLRIVSETIQLNIRKIDIPVRYGGDEFVLILPNTGYEGATILLKRLQRALSELTVQGCKKIGLSGGIAVFPDDGKTAEEIIGIANKRMYQNKRTRKKRVILYRTAINKINHGGELND